MADPTGPERGQDSLTTAEENRAMFDKIAGYYDSTNRILSLGWDESWRRQGVASLEPLSGGHYLDVGCGTGDIALEILRQSPSSRVTGIDPSEGMLVLGREKVRDAGLTEAISLEQGDVLNLRFEENCFDGAMTSFCIRNVTDRKRALAEIFRVVRPGGLFVIVELTEPDGSLMRPLFRLYARVVMPLVTGILSSASAYRYLAESMADFPRAGTFTSLMNQAGFVDITHRRLTGGIVTLFQARVPKLT
jgi:demethylmenaquinone methyltransferase / 2-methoxy-6-polyprenyl-1,4-benzoquinol methylase